MALTEDIGAVEKMVREDAHVTYMNTEASLRIGSGSVAKILHIYLRVSKVSSCGCHTVSLTVRRSLKWNNCCEMLRWFNNGNSRHNSENITGDETWIYQYDTETKHYSSVWVFPNNDWTIKVKMAKVLGRKWCSLSLLQVVMWQQYHLSVKGQRLHSGTPQFLQKLREKHPRAGLRGILLHHDNASAHATHLTMDFLRGTPVQLFHPPYSPDLAPGWPFSVPYGEGLTAWEAVFNTWRRSWAYQGELCALDDSDWRQCFKSCFRSMWRCIDAQGEYFEKM